ncbi:MAG: TRAP transporter large permease [Pseudomonadota bacterium]|jgi:tripartite ATP-independent transporter DctM subunit|nr:TRAP transporter large permease [Pseudomonadota bacterium]
MTPLEVGGYSLVLMVVLIVAGLDIAITLLLLSSIGVWLIRGSLDVTLSLFAQAASDTISSQEFAVVPMFILMGLLVSTADLGKDLFAVAHRLCGRLRGGLGVATVFANAVFAAITGISIASASVFTKVAVPEMLAYGYSPRFATGVVAGSSVLGMLIPPSLLMILYAFLAQQSVGAMFLAGIGPGLVLTAVYSIGIVAMARFTPHRVMRVDSPPPPPPAQGITGLLRTAPIGILIVVVLGGIYGGVFTATDAGAVGAVGALIIALARGKLSASSGWQVAKEAGSITVAVLFLIIAANLYSRMLALSGLPQVLIESIAAAGLGATGFILVYIAVVVALGCIIDSASIMLLVLPLVLPVVAALQIDPVWFGVVTVIAVEIGLLTPPFGLSVLTIKSALGNEGIGVADIFIGSLPFVLMMILVLALLVLFPGIALMFT